MAVYNCNNIIPCFHDNNRPLAVNSKDILWLAELLPETYIYHVCSFEANRGEITARLDISTKDGAMEWLKALEQSTLTTYRVERTYPSYGEKVIYKAEFRCQHRTKPRTATADQRRGSKNTNCPASLSMVIKTNTFATSEGKKRKCRSLDPHMPNQPMVVKIKFNHNHPQKAADALRHRDVKEDVKEKLLELFRNGYSPSKALDLHKYDLQLEHQENYAFMSADRALIPDLPYCYRLYYNKFRKEYGKLKGKLVLKELERKLTEGTVGKNCIRLKIIDPEKKKAAVAIVTPLMKRVHQLIKHSGELVFVDALGNVDRQGCRVFLLLTHSFAGGLPLGVLITTNESTDTVTEALNLYNSLLDDSAYFGRGWKSGPDLFMMDDSPSEMHALHTVYPDATLLLCVFHLLQAFWHFLWEAKNGVQNDDRPQLFLLLKDMVYCDTVDSLEARYQEVIRDGTLLKYSKVVKHIEDIYARRYSWAVSYQTGLNICNNNTNNYAEVAMRIMKDQILERTKSYNVIQLVDFIMTRLETYYKRRLLDVCNDHLDTAMQLRFLPSVTAGSQIDQNQITQIAENMFMVPSEEDSNSYVVDVSVGMCSCKMGKTGGPCKHQYLVLKKYNIHSWNFIPVSDPLTRILLYRVATGCSDVPEDLFQSLYQQQPALLTDSMTTTNLVSSGDTSDHPDRSTPDNSMPDEHDDGNGDDYGDSNLQLESLHLQHSLQNQFDGRTCQTKPGELKTEITDDTQITDDTLLNELKEVFVSLQEQYLSDKDYLSAPLKAFMNQAKVLTSGTHSELASALHCFGKYSGVE